MENPLVVITGASSGIGESCAHYFHKEGHPLLLLARRVEKMEKEFGKLKNVLIEKVDITKYSEISAALEKAEKLYGPCDCLINNAGVMLLGRMEDQKLEEWDAMMQVNVYGVLNGIKCVLKGMKERKSGTIINISSMAGVKLFDNHTVYCATKFAVNAISEGVRAEVATSGVKVTTICPGVVE
ncbi:short chain dehydrogenase, partial [Reticulomyxa filosa]